MTPIVRIVLKIAFRNSEIKIVNGSFKLDYVPRLKKQVTSRSNKIRLRLMGRTCRYEG